jgi:hypothetical protein
LYDEALGEYIQLDDKTKLYVTIKKEPNVETTDRIFVELTKENNSTSGHGIILTIPYDQITVDPGYYWWDVALVRFDEEGIENDYEVVIPTSPCRIIPSVYF